MATKRSTAGSKPTAATKTTKGESRNASSAASRSPLEAGLDRAAAAYARHMLTGKRTVPVYSARLDGPYVLLDVHAPDGVQHVKRRASAYLQLCADLWGRSRPPAGRALMPTLIGSLTSHPDGGANGWTNFHALESDPEWVDGLETVAKALIDGAREEAILLLRRLYEVDERFGPDRTLVDAGMRRRTAPPEIAEEVAARSAVTPESEWYRSTSPQAAVKRVVPFASSKDATERLAVAQRIAMALPHLSHSNHLAMYALVDGVLPALMSDGDGAVHEVAVGIAQNLGMKLLYVRAYPEAKKLLDIAVAHHVELAETLRARWECRLYLDACAGTRDLDAAEEDWKRAADLDSPTDESSMGRCIFWTGDVRDRRRVAIARVAAALVARAEGGDPCEDRKVAKKDLPDAAEKARLLARAAALSDSAVKKGKARVERDLDRARKTGAALERGFQAEEYAARAKVREASGDLAGALVDYEAARELRVAGGISYQIDHFGPDIRRLRRLMLEPQGAAASGVPESFDPEWFLDEERTSKEREAAATAWFAEPWRKFPKTPKAARGRPFAYVLLRDVLADSADIWKVAAKDEIDLGDRVAFGMRALRMLDAWFDRRDASRLEDVLDDSYQVAFFGEGCSLDSKTAKQRRPLFTWVKDLASADELDEAVVLRGLEGGPWRELEQHFISNVDTFDPLRDLFDAVRRARLDGDAIALVLGAYQPLLKNDWSALGQPRGAAKGWLQHGEALARLDGDAVAPALIAWTRAQQAVPGFYGRPKLDAKWLWPLYYAWSDAHCPAFLEEVAKGKLDNGKSLSRSQKATRRECLDWLEERR